MRAIILFFAGCLMASASSDYPAATLYPGDAVKTEALAAMTYLRGNGPAQWEQGKVYIIDCWATWCVPSKTIIPRLNKLHTDYQAKGLRVIGVSVFGEDKTKVESFLKSQGSAMSYPVAIADKEGAFEAEWLMPANLSSLPNAYVVKNGKLLFIIHPWKITAETVEGLLAGGDQETAVLKKLQPVVDPGQRAVEVTAARKKRVDLLLYGGGNMDHEVAFYDNILAKNPDLHPEDKQRVLLNKAHDLGKMKQFDAAIQVLDEAKALAPDSQKARDIAMARQTYLDLQQGAK